MRRDSRLIMSNAQAITADAASTSCIDLGSDRNIGAGRRLWFLAWLDEAFNTLTSLDIKLQSDSDAGFATALRTHITQNFALASLTPAGQRLVAAPLPLGIQRYVRSYYEVNGTDPTTGKISSTIAYGIDIRKMFPKGYSI